MTIGLMSPRKGKRGGTQRSRSVAGVRQVLKLRKKDVLWPKKVNEKVKEEGAGEGCVVSVSPGCASWAWASAGG